MKDRYLVHEFSRLTKVTVRTLHYYDQIGLLSPKEHTRAGARLYAEADLVRLQQVITLKFMGFSLSEIKRLLDQPGYSLEKALQVQAQAVEEEITRLRRASQALRQTIGLVASKRQVDWKKIIIIMESIRMSEEKKTKWTEEFFTPEEMKEFEKAGQAYTPAQMEAYQRKWADLLAEVEANLTLDPASPKARDLARRWRALFKEGWGGRPDLSRKIGEAYRSGAVPHGLGPSPRAFEFIRKVEEAARKK
jgi:DNA-binding transcriptional MerR regulator